MGVDCFKTDFGERIPTDVVYSDGSDPEKMHNYYTFLYNRLVFETLKRLRARAKRSSSPARRPSAASASRCTGAATMWSTYESMAESLRGGLSLGLSGFGFWSHDIGGFQNTAPAACLQTLVRLRPVVEPQPAARMHLLSRAVDL